MTLPTSLIRVSIDPNGNQLSDFSGFSRLGLDNTGNLITFNSLSPELAADVGTDFGVGQGYLKNVATGAVSLVDDGILQADLEQLAINPVLSSDGSTAAYILDGGFGLFVHEIGTDAQIAAGRTGDGSVVDGMQIDFPALGSHDLDGSGDNIVYNGFLEATNELQALGSEVYHYDVAADSVRRLDVNFDGSVNDKTAQHVRISDDGNYATFVSFSSKIVEGDENGIDETLPDFGDGFDFGDLPGGEDLGDFDFGEFQDLLGDAPNFGTADVFRTDLATGATILVSRRDDESQFETGSFAADISGDGRYVVFENNDENAMTSVWRRDVDSGRTELVSARPDGIPAAGRFDAAGFTPGAGDSRGASVSADGRYVTFWSDSGLLAADHEPDAFDLFVKDMDTGALARLGHAATLAADTGVSNFGHGPAEISANGRWIAFASGAEDLVPGDDNGRQDVFRVANPLLSTQNAKGILDDFQASGTVPAQEIPGVFELPDELPDDPADFVTVENGRVIIGGQEFTFPALPPFWFEAIQARIDDAILIDPPVATGYDYRLPNAADGMGFRTLEVPEVGGDASFELTVYADDGSVAGSRTIAAREEIDLTQFGANVTHFAVAGIAPSVALDPDDGMAFPVALTFTQAGTVDVQQTPLVREVDSANVFLGAARGLTLDGSARVFGRSEGNESLFLTANASNVRTDANLERLDVEAGFDSLAFAVTDQGLTISRGGETLVTVPSLNGDLELRFTDGDASARQTGAARFEISGGDGGRVTVDPGGASGGLTLGQQTAERPAALDEPAANIFLTADSSFTLNEPATVFGRSFGDEGVTLGPDARGVRLDANVERLGLERNLDELSFRVGERGLEIVDGGDVLATLPSLNQGLAMGLVNGTAQLDQTGAQAFALAFGGQRAEIEPDADVIGADLPLAASALTAADDLMG